MHTDLNRIKSQRNTKRVVALLLPVFCALAASSVTAQTNGYFVVQPSNTNDVPTIELKLPNASGTGVTISYVPEATANTALFQLPSYQDSWQWQSWDQGTPGAPRLQMSLKSDNSLELVNTAGNSTIVLKPGTSQALPEITIGGAAVLTTATGITPGVANATYAPINPSVFTVGPNGVSGGLYGFAAGCYNDVRAECAVALGQQNWVSGNWGFAAGLQNQVTELASGAIGYQNLASGWGSFAAGVNAYAIGANAIALGRAARSTEDFSFAAGYASKATGYSASAIGNDVTASGNYSTAFGFGTASSGDYTTALGAWTKATYYGSLAGGAHSEANGLASTSLGYETRANGAYQIAVGHFNDPQGTPSVIAPTDSLFIVGNGTDADHRSNAFVVKDNGDTLVSGNLVVNGSGETIIGGSVRINKVPRQGDILMGEFGNPGD